MGETVIRQQTLLVCRTEMSVKRWMIIEKQNLAYYSPEHEATLLKKRVFSFRIAWRRAKILNEVKVACYHTETKTPPKNGFLVT